MKKIALAVLAFAALCAVVASNHGFVASVMVHVVADSEVPQ
jgi:hypothetical protein